MFEFPCIISLCYIKTLDALTGLYIIPTHYMNRWLLLQFLVILMMDAESVRNMSSDLAVTNKQYCQSCILLVLYIIYFINKLCEFAGFRCVRKIAKADYYLRHVRPSVRMEQLGSRRTDFHEI